MKITILLDHDLEGQVVFLKAGLRETGWDQHLTLEFKRLRDLNLPEDYTDQEIWRYAQQQRLLLLTNNRNKDDATSLQAIIEQENTPAALPVITLSDKDELALADYRLRVISGLAEIIIDLDNYLGTGRIFLP